MSVITCEDEDAAFSIFDSLNTTGVPLTAIQTLKPYVMRDYRDSRSSFKDSPVEESFRYVEKIIRDAGNDANKQSDVSKEFAIHASLLGGDANIINNNLSLQRSVLREIHQNCMQNGDIDLSSTVLKKLAEFRSELCYVDGIRNYSAQPTLSNKEEDEAKLISIFLANNKNVKDITTIEKFEHFYKIANDNFIKNQVQQKVNSLLGDAFQVLNDLKLDKFDIIFIDGDKGNYLKIFKKIEKNNLKKDSLILIDDIFFHGDILNKNHKSPKTKGVISVLNYLKNKKMYNKTILPIYGGVLLIQKI